MTLADEVFSYTPELIREYAAAKIVQLMDMLFIGMGVLFILYVINAFAMGRICRKMRFPSVMCGAAWIPFASPYIEGRIYDFICDKQLKRSNIRIHYMMFNVAFSAAFCGSYMYSLIRSIDQCMEMYNTGTIPISLMSGTSDAAYTAVCALTVVLGIICALFRMKSVIVAHMCFEKSKGLFFSVIIAIFLPFAMPLVYNSISKLEPVNMSMEAMMKKYNKK